MPVEDTLPPRASPPSVTLNFLDWVLPTAGLRVGFRARDKRNEFFATSAELSEWLLTQDALGETVYHACATYKVAQGDGRGRKASNVLSLKSFWLDVDAGEEKDAYSDAAEAAEAVVNFSRAANLPVPVFVGSGLGLHCYWPLRSDLPLAEWKPYAVGLKALCALHGLHAGPERTADAASILRTPGTHWRKAGERVVRSGDLIGPYDISSFKHLLAISGGGPVRRWKHKSDGSQLDGSPPAFSALSSSKSVILLEAASHVHDYTPAFAEDIARECAQVNALKETRGNLPEPHWYATLGVLAFCEDGPEKAHEWSSGYEGYTEAETDSRLDRAKRLRGATTCAHFTDIADPSICARCPLLNKINSPISIRRINGWHGSTPEVLPSAPSPDSSVSSASPASLSSTTISTANPFAAVTAAPLPFAWSSTMQLMFLGENAKGKADNIIVSQYPIYLESVQTGEVTSDSFSYRFKQWLPQEGWLEIALTAEQVMGANGMGKLFSKGAAIRDAQLFKQFVVLSIDQFNETNRLKMRFDQFGWKQDESGFLYGKNFYSPKGVDPALGSEEVRTRSQWLGPRAGGSLAKWSHAASSLFAQGCEPQSFALLAAFAAPLMRFHAAAEGGAVVSLQSEESGSGKTTALTAAASVWGRMDGLSLVNIDTGVAKSLTLSALGNLPVIYDEFSNRDPEVVKDFIIVFTNGRDKMRGTIDGTIRHTAAGWQTLLIAACNLSLVDLVNSVGGTDAPGFRVLEFGGVALPSGISHKKGDQLRKDLEANSGHAGDAYLRYLVQPDVMAFVRQAMPKYTDDLWEKTGLSSEHRFRIRAVASVGIAATLVGPSGLNMLPFSPQRIIDWAIEQVKNKHDAAPITGQRGFRAISVLSRFLGEHISNVVVVAGAHQMGRDDHMLVQPSGKLLIRLERKNGRLAISEDALQRWMSKNQISYAGFVQKMQESGLIIERRRMASLGVGTTLPSVLQACIEINMNDPQLSGVAAPVEQLVRRVS